MVCIIVFGLIFATNAGVVSVATSEAGIDLQARSALLMDWTTGTVLFEKNPNQKLPMASITKIMTVLLTLEAIERGEISLEDPVEVSRYAAGMGGSTIFLAKGEVFPVSTLLKAVIMASANDASVALAEKIAGSHQAFVDKMNERAKQLGMKETNFKNSTGLPAEGQASTAYDIALMSSQLLRHPLFFKWSTIWLDYMRDDKTMIVNTNRLVRFYDGCDGIKTGFTSEAGHCLAATAVRDNMRLISIIMSAPNSKIRFAEAAKLLDYGFANYRLVPVVQSGQVIQKEVPLLGGKETKIEGLAAKSVSLLVKTGEKQDFKQEIQMESKLYAPIQKGQKIGSMLIVKDGKTYAQTDIISDREVGVAGVFDYLKRIFVRWLKA
jgi:D-alanyl-D-alanine carboxypeptidase (penicillin-binding protein 5/6)